MNAFVPVTPLSDPRRPMPAGAHARFAAADAAVTSLAAEQRRLERLGQEWPLARAESFAAADHGAGAGQDHMRPGTGLQRQIAV